jgi:hypothetical protein
MDMHTDRPLEAPKWTLTGLVLPAFLTAAVNAGGGDLFAELQSGPPALALAPGMIRVTPGTSPTEAAAACARIRPGGRALVLQGFADDITGADRLNSANGRLPLQSPWLDKGVARVRSRVAGWIGKFSAAGGSADLFVIVQPQALAGTRLADLTRAQLPNIAADSRGAALQRMVGVSNLATAGSTVVGRAAWSAMMRVQSNRAIDQAIAAPIESRFPTARVGCQLADAERVAGPDLSGQIGSVDIVRFTASQAPGGYASIASVVGAIRRSVTATRGVIPVVSPRSEFLAAVGADADPYWRELVIHAALSSPPGAICGSSRLSTADSAAAAAVRDSIVSAGAVGGVPVHLSAPTDSDPVIASGITVGERLVWRVTFPAGINEYRFALKDGTSQVVTAKPPERGAWFTTSRSNAPALNASGSAILPAAPSTVNERPYVILADGAPTPAYASPISWEKRYLIVYQNNADRGAAATGIIDPLKVVAEVQRLVGTGAPPEWGVLDFEEPFDSILINGPSDARYAATVSSLCATIDATKAAFPSTKWTYYGFPHVPYFPNGTEWDRLAPSARTALLRRFAENYGPVLSKMDWFMPCVYDVFEQARGLPLAAASESTRLEHGYRIARLEAIQMHVSMTGEERKPVIPAVSPWFQPGGGATTLAPIPLPELLSDQIQPCIDAGANGFALWGAMDYFFRIATLPPERVGPALAPAQFAYREILTSAYPPNGRRLSVNGPVEAYDWNSADAGPLLGQQLNATQSAAVRAIAERFGN